MQLVWILPSVGLGIIVAVNWVDRPLLFSCSPALPISWGLQPCRWATPDCTRGPSGMVEAAGPYPVGLSLTDVWWLTFIRPLWGPTAGTTIVCMHCRLWYYKLVVQVCVCVHVFMCMCKYIPMYIRMYLCSIRTYVSKHVLCNTDTYVCIRTCTYILYVYYSSNHFYLCAGGDLWLHEERRKGRVYSGTNEARIG